MIPFKIYTRKKIFKHYTGMSFFLFIWISKLTTNEEQLIRHEKIHFLQQLELLFLFHWVLYGMFYLWSRCRGHGHYAAYRFNPFEIEAYDNEHDVRYLYARKPFAWIGCYSAYTHHLRYGDKQQSR